ncbi:uncharacterized protein WM294_013745 [Sarcoramphus papa]
MDFRTRMPPPRFRRRLPSAQGRMRMLPGDAAISPPRSNHRGRCFRSRWDRPSGATSPSSSSSASWVSCYDSPCSSSAAFSGSFNGGDTPLAPLARAGSQPQASPLLSPPNPPFSPRPKLTDLPDMTALMKKRTSSPRWKLHPLNEAATSFFRTVVTLCTRFSIDG